MPHSAASSPAPRLRHGVPVPVAMLIVLCLLAGAAALVLFFFDPREYQFYPFCFFYRTTGLLCPGCGALRASHQLLHGQWGAAFQFNPMLVLTLPIVGWATCHYLVQRLRNRPPSLGVRPRWLWLALGVVLLVSVLRNLPGMPFSLPSP